MLTFSRHKKDGQEDGIRLHGQPLSWEVNMCNFSDEDLDSPG